MFQTINYNPMLMMLYNLKPNVLVVADFANFDENETNLINQAKKVQQQESLDLALMNLQTLNAFQTSVYSLNTINSFAQANNANYAIQYLVSEQVNQNDLFASIKNLLNVHKIVINNNFMVGNQSLDPTVLNQVFGQDNVILVDQLPVSESLIAMQNNLQTGNVQAYLSATKTPYTIHGEVIEGKKLGRVLGFPTANIKVNPNSFLKHGVYYTKVKLPNDDKIYNGMSCYWVNEQNENLVETYLFNFDQDIYHWYIEIQFQEFIRENKAVSSQDELVELLNQDAQWIHNHQK